MEILVTAQRVLKNWLQNESASAKECPAPSPDPNPTEYFKRVLFVEYTVIKGILLL